MSKHIYNFSNMGGRKCQVVTSTELTPELLAKYKKALGIACTHTEEPLGNDIARPVTTDIGVRPMSRIEELLEAWNGGYYSTLEVHELIDTLKLERDQMTARCSRLEEGLQQVLDTGYRSVAGKIVDSLLNETPAQSLREGK